MPSVTLNPREISLLKQWIRRQSPNDDIQQLLDLMNPLLDERTGAMDIPDPVLTRIQDLAFAKGNPLCSATLLSVFQRTLGSDLGKG